MSRSEAQQLHNARNALVRAESELRTVGTGPTRLLAMDCAVLGRRVTILLATAVRHPCVEGRRDVGTVVDLRPEPPSSA